MSEKKRKNKFSNGKVDSPRNNFSKSFKENYSKINWDKRKRPKTKK